MFDLSSAEIGKHVLHFFTNGVAGYFLQFLGYSLAIHAFNKRKAKPLPFFLMTLIFAVSAFGIRELPINFGFHTILIMSICIVVSYFAFKMAIYPTVLGILLTTVSILVFEALVVYGIFGLILGSETVDSIIKAETDDLDSKISKSLLGIPTNFLLVIEMFILYKVLPKKLKKGDNSGETGKKIS